MWNPVARVSGSRGSWDAAYLRGIIAPDALRIHEAVQRLAEPGWIDVDMEPHGLLASTYEPIFSRNYFVEVLPRAADLVIIHARRRSSLGYTPCGPTMAR
jgi:hypothetical protein